MAVTYISRNVAEKFMQCTVLKLEANNGSGCRLAPLGVEYRMTCRNNRVHCCLTRIKWHRIDETLLAHKMLIDGSFVPDLIDGLVVGFTEGFPKGILKKKLIK